MFGLFKSDPAKKLRKQYSAKLEEAMLAQRNGDIRSYASLSRWSATNPEPCVRVRKRLPVGSLLRCSELSCAPISARIGRASSLREPLPALPWR